MDTFVGIGACPGNSVGKIFLGFVVKESDRENSHGNGGIEANLCIVLWLGSIKSFYSFIYPFCRNPEYR